jgi:single-stranded DNA-binding protein
MFRMAVSGRRELEPSFFTVLVWRDQAEHAAESLSKGSRVVVVGRLQQRTWTAEDASARSIVEVVAEELGPSLRWPDDDDPGRRAARTRSQLDQTMRRYGTRSRPAFRTVVSVLVSFVGRTFSTMSRPALRAACGRPPARQRHHGTRGATSPSATGDAQSNRQLPTQSTRRPQQARARPHAAEPRPAPGRSIQPPLSIEAAAQVPCSLIAPSLRRLATGEVSEDGLVTCS